MADIVPYQLPHGLFEMREVGIQIGLRNGQALPRRVPADIDDLGHLGRPRRQNNGAIRQVDLPGRQHSRQAARVHALRRPHGALSADLHGCRRTRL